VLNNIEIKCKVKDCNKNSYTIGYCNRHYKQYWRHKCILNRTRFDPNEIVVYDNYAEIVIYDKNNNPKEKRIIIDLDDIEKIKNLKWSLDSKGYPTTTINNQKIRMHRLILDLNKHDSLIDHKNKNRLDNRKNNFRIATNSNNEANKKKQKNNTSGFTGIFNVDNKWGVRIQYYKEKFELGFYKNKDIAISVRLQGEKIIFKNFAPNINKFYLIIDEIKQCNTIKNLKHIAKKIDNQLTKPIVNRMDEETKELLLNDIKLNSYNNNELLEKYQISISTLNRYKRIIKEMEI
jgi:exonuclease VII large subunit